MNDRIDLEESIIWHLDCKHVVNQKKDGIFQYGYINRLHGIFKMKRIEK